MNTPTPRQELLDLALVAGGAIPGALLRWRLCLLAEQSVSPLPDWIDGNLVANLLGCLLIGLLVARPRPRLFLWAGIGFCGSLTTFSGWMLQLSQLLQRGHGGDALLLLLVSLGGGLLCTSLAEGVARRR